MRLSNSKTNSWLSPQLSVADNSGPQPATVQWPFPNQLIRPSDQPPLSQRPIRTFADMTTEVGEALW